MSVSIRPLAPEDIPACIAINRLLPGWFVLEEGLAEAEGYMHTQAGLVAVHDLEIVGFVTYTYHFPHSAEISWMAVTPVQHRHGVGRALIRKLEMSLRGSQLLSVKTLADSHPIPEYAITRAFYRSVGFDDQMVFPDLWDSSNPCLLMVKMFGHQPE